MANLLVVEDDVDIRNILIELLCAEGHEVRGASNGAEALSLFLERTADLIVLDVEMPVLDGVGMAERLPMAVPIVLISGSRNLTEAATRIGTPYFLAKPFVLEALEELVQRALSEAASARVRLRSAQG